MPPKYTIRNFGRNVEFAPAVFHEPTSEAEILEILRRHRGRKIRVVGRLHSWSECVRAEEVCLDLRQLDSVRVARRDGSLMATVGAGCSIRRLLAELRREAGATLPTTGLITAQSIAGAISTGTHGSGRHSLSHYVTEVRLATYDAATGEPVVRVITDPADLRAARCSLGAMGIILSVTIPCRCDYRIEEHAASYDTLEEVLTKEDEYPLQQFYLVPWQWRYYAQHRRETSAPRSRSARLYRWYWLWVIDVGLHVCVLTLARLARSWRAARLFYTRVFPCFVARDWIVVDRAQEMLVMHHDLFRHIEIEVFVKARHVHDALQFVREILSICAGDADAVTETTKEQLAGAGLLDDLHALGGRYVHHYPICIRKVLPDDTYISMAAGDEPYYALSFISFARPRDRDRFLEFARFIASSTARLFEARPHWGKVCPLDSEAVESLYPWLSDFRDACSRYDEARGFSNAWVTALWD